MSGKILEVSEGTSFTKQGEANPRLATSVNKYIDRLKLKIVMKISALLTDLIELIKQQNIVKECLSNEDFSKYVFIVSDYKLTNIINVKISDLCELTDDDNMRVKLHVVVAPLGCKQKQIVIENIYQYEYDETIDDINNIFIKWTKDIKFIRIQKGIQMNLDPIYWSEKEVKIWLKCASLKLKINGIKYHLWRGINGKKLCNLTSDEFEKIAPTDKNKLLWTQLFIIKKQNWFGKIDCSIANDPNDTQMKQLVCASYLKCNVNEFAFTSPLKASLARFLYDLLENSDHTDIIKWTEKHEYKFRIVEPLIVYFVWCFIINKGGLKLSSSKLVAEIKNYKTIVKVKNKPGAWKFIDFNSIPGKTIDEKLGFSVF